MVTMAGQSGPAHGHAQSVHYFTMVELDHMILVWYWFSRARCCARLCMYLSLIQGYVYYLDSGCHTLKQGACLHSELLVYQMPIESYVSNIDDVRILTSDRIPLKMDLASTDEMI